MQRSPLEIGAELDLRRFRDSCCTGQETFSAINVVLVPLKKKS
jgi:hypothetical protein